MRDRERVGGRDGRRLRAARLEFDGPQDDVAAVDLPDGIRSLSKIWAATPRRRPGRLPGDAFSRGAHGLKVVDNPSPDN
jgi:hypothetical protein